jgi:hypothetical protein
VNHGQTSQINMCVVKDGSCALASVPLGFERRITLLLQVPTHWSSSSGAFETLAQAVLAAQHTENEHRSQRAVPRNLEGTADVGAEFEDANRAVPNAGLDVISNFESILRNLAQGR